MKNLKKYIFIISAICFSVFVNSCTEKVEYTEADKTNGAQVYFPNTIPAQIDLDRNSTNYVLQLMRVNTSGALTVELNVESETDLLHIPSSAEFADGSNVAEINISYSLDELGYDNFYDVKISVVDENLKTLYGVSTLNFSIGIPAPWVTMKGKATYIDDFMTTFYTVENEPYNVEIQESELYKGLYRLVYPYGEAYPYNEEGDYDDSKTYYLEINACDPNAVYMNVQETGMDWGYGMVSVGSEAGFRIANNGWTVEQAKAAGLTGTLKDGIITFPKGKLLISMAQHPSNPGGLYYANNNGAFLLALPGVELKDYSLSVNYSGKHLSSSGETEGIIAQIDQVGEDVESLSLAVIEGNDEEIDTAAVLKQAMQVSFNSDNLPASFVIPFKDKSTGFYTIVAIAQAGDEVCSLATSVFKYNADIKEIWIDKYKGTYSYALLTDQENNPAVEESLIMSQNQENPSLWRITGSEAMDDFTFIYNEDDNQIYVNESTLLGGTLYVANSVDADGLPVAGNKLGDTYTFKVNYYDPYGNYGDYEETFVITGYATEGSTYKSVGTRSFDSFVKKQINSYKSFKKVSIPFEY